MTPEETKEHCIPTRQAHGAFLITSNMLKVFVSNYPEVFKSIKEEKKSKLPKPQSGPAENTLPLWPNLRPTLTTENF